MAKSNAKHLVDFDDIQAVVSTLSPSLSEYLDQNKASSFSLWYKDLTHSDLYQAGKRIGSEGLENNLLYYLSLPQMQKMEADGEKLPNAKQTNIGIPTDFYDEIGCPRPRDVTGKDVKLNHYADVFLVNDSLEHFTVENTRKVLAKLGKTWNELREDVRLNHNAQFTPIIISVAVHGLWKSDDTNFSRLRQSMFLNDTLYLLIEKNKGSKKVFLFLEKNPIFFSITGMQNYIWVKQFEDFQGTEEEKTRAMQSAWKDMLAKEMMNYTTKEGEVFCPFTYLNAKYEDVPMLFIASHIKRFADCTKQESFDINNGLLLCANADALFDKYMITVGEDKDLIFSGLIDDEQLKESLRLNHEIFKLILNEDRMKYMSEHRAVFYEKEKDRVSTPTRKGDAKNHPTPQNPSSITYDLPLNSPVRQVADDYTYYYASMDEVKVMHSANINNKKILIGCYKNPKHLRWISEKGLYNIRMGKRIGSVGDKVEDIPQPDILALYFKDNTQRVQFYKIKPGMGRVVSTEQMLGMGYPKKADSQCPYYVFELDSTIPAIKIDIKLIIESAIKNNQDYKKGMPIFIDL